MNQGFSNVVGFDNMLSDEKIELIKKFLSSQTLRNAAKGLFFVYSTLISIMDSVRGMKTTMRKNMESIIKTVDEFVQNEQYKDYSWTAIYYEMMRKGKAFMSLTSFYKYVKLFDNIIGRKKFKAKQKTGIRAEKPKEIIHADVCVYRPLDYTKCFIYFIVDDFSRMILGWKISKIYIFLTVWWKP